MRMIFSYLQVQDLLGAAGFLPVRL